MIETFGGINEKKTKKKRKNEKLPFLFRIDMLSLILRLFSNKIELSSSSSDQLDEFNVLPIEKFPSGREKFFTNIDHEESIHEKKLSKLRNRCFSRIGLAKFFFEIHGLVGAQNLVFMKNGSVDESSDLNYLQGESFSGLITDKSFSFYEDCEIEYFNSYCSIFSVIFSERLVAKRSFYSRDSRNYSMRRYQKKVRVFVFLYFVPTFMFVNQPLYSSTIHHKEEKLRIAEKNRRRVDVVEVKPILFFDGVFLDWNENEIITPQIAFGRTVSNSCFFDLVDLKSNNGMEYSKAMELIIKYNSIYKYSEVPNRKEKERNGMDFIHDFITTVLGGIGNCFQEKNILYPGGYQQKYFQNLFISGRSGMVLTITKKFYDEYLIKKPLRSCRCKELGFEIEDVEFKTHDVEFKTHKELDVFIRKINQFCFPQQFECEHPIMYQLLKCFDEVFWVLHYRDMNNIAYQPKPIEDIEIEYPSGCPFKK